MGKIYYLFDLLIILLGLDEFSYHDYKWDIKFIKKSHFVYPLGKPMLPYLLRYQGLAVDDYGFALDASNLGHPQPSLF